MSKQVLDKITLKNTQNGGTIDNDYTADEITEVELPENSDTVTTVEGNDVRRGYRKEFNATILRPASLSGLMPLMTERNDAEVTMTWKSGATTVLSGARPMVMPRGPVVPDNVSVWYDTDTSASDNPGNEGSNTADGSWTELASPLDETTGDPSVATRPDGRGLPFYIICQFVHDIPLFYDSTAYSNIKTEEDNSNEVRIAIENQAGDYLVYGDHTGGGMEVEIHQNASPEFDEVNHMVLRTYQTVDDFDDMITYPSGADKYFYGVRVEMEAWGHDESDILTENR